LAARAEGAHKRIQVNMDTFHMTLSPFQKRCVKRTDDRIILQPRRTGSTVMQRRLAKNRLESAGVGQVAVVLPGSSMRDIWLRDHGAAEEPNLITMSAEAGVERARRPGVVIVDQCQHISDIEFWKMQDCWPDDAEWYFRPLVRPGGTAQRWMRP